MSYLLKLNYNLPLCVLTVWSVPGTVYFPGIYHFDIRREMTYSLCFVLYFILISTTTSVSSIKTITRDHSIDSFTVRWSSRITFLFGRYTVKRPTCNDRQPSSYCKVTVSNAPKGPCGTRTWCHFLINIIKYFVRPWSITYRTTRCI